MEGEHFGAGDGAVALEEHGGGGLPVLLPVKGHAEGEDVHHLKVAHPAEQPHSYISTDDLVYDCWALQNGAQRGCGGKISCHFSQ